jgi:hypothetical protein
MKRHLLIFLILIGAGSIMAQNKVSDLSPAGAKWYSAPTGGTLYSGSDALINGTIYYGSQTVNGIESTSRLAVTAMVNPLPAPSFLAQPGASASPASDVIYTTESAKSSYVWTFPGTSGVDYTISSGGLSTDNTVTLQYLTLGGKIITINYTDNGCTAASATSSINTIVTGK